MTNFVDSSKVRRKKLVTLIISAIALIILLGSVLLITRLGSGDEGPRLSDLTVSNSPSVKIPNSASAEIRKKPGSDRSKITDNPSDLPEIWASQLPVEARKTLVLILRNGPFPFARDGTIFGNFEGILPKRPGGYYREYTVPTPGSSNRGARRIVVGEDGEKYYTDDHYSSFSFIQEGR